MYNPEELNEVQKSAVLDTEGAVLVTAGAGSGKTRLLTHRIAHLVKDLKVPPYNILAITFTNKAADEMRERLQTMLDDDADDIWIFTFHAACVRILRRYIDRLGFGKNFTIYGETETRAVIKRVCKELDINEDLQKRILSEISGAKSKGIRPEDYAEVFKYSQDADEIGKAYAGYQNALRTNNALDYDDLLILTLKLLKENDEAREYYSNKFRYIHIDEFQDTNVVQYEIASILASKWGNVFAVGDEDQSIYSWRGASADNINKFLTDFSCKVYKLEQNYRSTSNILAVANKIIKCNGNRLEKVLWTSNGEGSKVVCFGAATDGFEADYVVRTIHELVYDGEFDYSDCAVLFRLNALTRPFEERFLQYGIPHRVFGGFKFYDRKEIKDVLAYARLSVNPRDDEAVFRVIKFPRRGIGDASIEKIREHAKKTGKSAFEVITDADNSPFPTALKTKLAEYGKTLLLLKQAAEGSVTSYFKYLLFSVLNVSGLFSDGDEDRARLENIWELVNSVNDFSKKNGDATLEDYLQTVSLYSDTDDINTDNSVTLATVHSAKGLEFPVVFVIGLEDGVFPSLRVNENSSDRMEEERRLMYVAVTRAKRRLYLTYSKSRFLYGETRYGIPSRFLCECGLAERPYDGRDIYTSSPSFDSLSRFAKKSAGGFASGNMSDGYSGESFKGAYKSDFGKRPSAPPLNSAVKREYAEGMTVMHKRLGKGKIVGIEKQGNGVYLKIDFERGGVMLLAADFAPLSIVEE